MASNASDNKGHRFGEWPESEVAADHKPLLEGNAAIILALDEQDFQDAMKRSIILGICTRLATSGERTMADLALEIRQGAMAFLKANMEQSISSPSDDEAMSVRDITSRRRPTTSNFKRPASAGWPCISDEAIAEAKAQRAAVKAEKPVDGDALLERIRSRMADALVSDPSGSDEGDKGK